MGNRRVELQINNSISTSIDYSKAAADTNKQPSWPNGYGIGLLSRGLRVRVPPRVHFEVFMTTKYLTKRIPPGVPAKAVSSRVTPRMRSRNLADTQTHLAQHSCLSTSPSPVADSWVGLRTSPAETLGRASTAQASTHSQASQTEPTFPVALR